MWTTLNYSKKDIRRAGDYLINSEYETDKPAYLEAYDKLENWRTSHAYPIQSMLAYFRTKAFEVDPKCLVARRLKRTPSILSKLKREDGMKLDRVEDIGGIRIVVATKKNVYEVRNAIVGGRTRNILRRERDYIKNPKQSGYRGVHLIYRYNGGKIQYHSHSVELQIRSNVQHSWATAVEVVGTFTRQALKASQGTDDWLNFFKLASIAFQDIEDRSIQKNVTTEERRELIKYIDDLDVINKLRAFAVSTNHLGKEKKNERGFFLLLLEIDKAKVKVMRFQSNEFDLATRKYAKLEVEYSNVVDRDVVLVSAESLWALKKAYPNYFADTAQFSKNLKKLLASDRRYIESVRSN